ncbi:hypothetical protein Tdes44962_MAKER03808 [Teratosphaeria destructans]|uniref:Uncharacterized protein n=1 Tax=Teratosphaeria destructans TaxID=418781 RepID=A0A9W7SNV0_9PEZI|nr:hypothetical protein Tdes44962_MAKER03808 [Teratosphaeria destructans]
MPRTIQFFGSYGHDLSLSVAATKSAASPGTCNSAQRPSGRLTAVGSHLWRGKDLSIVLGGK